MGKMAANRALIDVNLLNEFVVGVKKLNCINNMDELEIFRKYLENMLQSPPFDLTKYKEKFIIELSHQYNLLKNIVEALDSTIDVVKDYAKPHWIWKWLGLNSATAQQEVYVAGEMPEIEEGEETDSEGYLPA